MKGIITKQQEKEFAQLLDKVVKWDKIGEKTGNKIIKIALGFVEMFDGKFFELGITYLDDTLADKLDEELKPFAGGFVIACTEKDYENIELNGQMLLNKLVDIPGITEDTEAIFLSGMLKGLIEAVRVFLFKQDIE